MLSDIRKASPSDSVGQPERQSRGRDGQASLGRMGNESAGRAANAMMHDYSMPEYGSVKKVMPKSRDMGMDGNGNSYSSRPQDNYQSITIDQGYPDQ